MRSRTILVSALLSIQLLAAHAALPTTTTTTTTSSVGLEESVDIKDNMHPHPQQPSPVSPMKPRVPFRAPRNKDLFENKFEVDPKPLGNGKHGTVHAVTDKVTKERLAVKKVSVNTENRAQVSREVHILKLIKNQPHILHFHSVYENEKRTMTYLVTELIDGCSLDRFSYLATDEMDTKEDLDPIAITTIARQLLQALDYVHKEGWVHNDVKPANVMLSKRGGVKLIDFGYCCPCDSDSTSIQGTPFFVSPEKFYAVISPAADVWALGVTIFSLYSNPYSPEASYMDMEQFGDNIIESGCPWSADDVGKDPWEGLSDEAREFCEKCLIKDPSGRATAAKLVETDFIKQSCSDEKLDAYIQTL